MSLSTRPVFFEYISVMKNAKNRLKPLFRIAVLILAGMAILGYFIERGKKKSTPETNQSEIKNHSIASEKSFIPGLSAVDVYGNFEKIGFITRKDVGNELSTWTCEQETLTHNYFVEVTGIAPDKLVSIQGTFLNYSNENTDEKGRDFLGYVSTVSYEGSIPANARKWVQNNIGKNIKKIFGEVQFELFANSKSRILSITPVPRN